jgi:hypothetical protein
MAKLVWMNALDTKAITGFKYDSFHIGVMPIAPLDLDREQIGVVGLVIGS